MDRISGLRFLVDTGAEVNVLPSAWYDSVSKSPGPTLSAANSTSIATYGLRYLTLDLDQRRTFRWFFIVADVNQPILSSNFLTHFDLDVSMRHHRLVDRKTRLSIPGVLSAVAPTGLHTLIPLFPYARILEDFPEVTRPSNLNQPRKQSVTHHTAQHSAQRSPPHCNWRPCGVYRALNADMVHDSYPLPHIQDLPGHLE
ncbi:uncharacterized protein LOC142566639 [Dermacentor variabilis]|uniref:uncharacterized protein LOC142566639 n=1 Tax=Dermacentor variabilis TaxID=34621 RepID=UPI003F5B8C88